MQTHHCAITHAQCAAMAFRTVGARSLYRLQVVLIDVAGQVLAIKHRGLKPINGRVTFT